MHYLQLSFLDPSVTHWDDKKRSTDLSWALLAINIKKLTNLKKGKEAPWLTSYLYVLQNIGVFYSKRYDSAAFKCD